MKYIVLFFLSVVLNSDDLDFDKLFDSTSQNSKTFKLNQNEYQDVIDANEREYGKLNEKQKATINNALSSIAKMNKSSSDSIVVCCPNIPKPIDYSECSSAKTASGKYATVKLSRGGGMSSSECFELNVYAEGRIGVGNTCGGANGSWSVNINGQSGFATGLADAITWLLKRI